MSLSVEPGQRAEWLEAEEELQKVAIKGRDSGGPSVKALTLEEFWAARMNRPELFVAKVKGWPWWPAKLADPSSQGLEEKRGAGTFVYFFGTRRCAWVKAEFCLPFYENIHLIAAKGKQEKLDMALAELETTLMDPVDTRKFRQAIHVEQGSYIIPESDGGARSSNGTERKDAGSEAGGAGSKRKASGSPTGEGAREAAESAGQGGETAGTPVTVKKESGGAADGGPVAKAAKTSGGAPEGNRDSAQHAAAAPTSAPAAAKAAGPGAGAGSGAAAASAGRGSAFAVGPKEERAAEAPAPAHPRAEAASLAEARAALPKSEREDGRPLMLSEKVGWVGKPRPDHKKTFYDAFFKHGQVFRKGDCAYLKPPEEGVEPYVIRIESMWEERSGDMQFKGVWFYRPDEVKKPPPLACPEELFLSDWADVNPVESVMAKAKVLLLKAPPSAEQWAQAKARSMAHACCRAYFVRTNKFAALTDRKIGGPSDAPDAAHNAGGNDGAARKDHAEKPRVQEALEGLLEVSGRINRPEHWIPLHYRAAWSGVQYINRSNVLVRAEESLKPSVGSGRVTGLSLSPNGELLASVSLGGCFCVWDVASHSLRHQFVEKARSSQPLLEYRAVAFSHNGARCVVGGCKRDRNKFVPETDPPEHLVLGGFIKVFDLHRTDQLQTMDMHAGPVTRLLTGWAAGAGLLFSQSGGGEVVQWSFEEAANAFQKRAETQCVEAGGMLLSYTGEGAQLEAAALLVTSGRGLRVLDTKGLVEVGVGLELYGHRCTDVAFVPSSATSLLKAPADASLFLSCGEDSKGGNAVVKLHQLRWSSEGGARVPALEELRRYEMLATVTPLSEFPSCLVSNGRYAMRAVNTQLYVWNLDTRQLTAIVQHESGCTFTSMVLHPREKSLLMGALTGQIECYRQQSNS